MCLPSFRGGAFAPHRLYVSHRCSRSVPYRSCVLSLPLQIAAAFFPPQQMSGAVAGAGGAGSGTATPSRLATVIIAGQLATRGMRYKTSDHCSLYLTDLYYSNFSQLLHLGIQEVGRLCTVYRGADEPYLRLWCTQRMWDHLYQMLELEDFVVQAVKADPDFKIASLLPALTASASAAASSSAATVGCDVDGSGDEADADDNDDNDDTDLDGDAGGERGDASKKAATVASRLRRCAPLQDVGGGVLLPDSALHAGHGGFSAASSPEHIVFEMGYFVKTARRLAEADLKLHGPTGGSRVTAAGETPWLAALVAKSASLPGPGLAFALPVVLCASAAAGLATSAAAGSMVSGAGAGAGSAVSAASLAGGGHPRAEAEGHQQHQRRLEAEQRVSRYAHLAAAPGWLAHHFEDMAVPASQLSNPSIQATTAEEAASVSTAELVKLASASEPVVGRPGLTAAAGASSGSAPSLLRPPIAVTCVHAWSLPPELRAFSKEELVGSAGHKCKLAEYIRSRCRASVNPSQCADAAIYEAHQRSPRLLAHAESPCPAVVWRYVHDSADASRCCIIVIERIISIDDMAALPAEQPLVWHSFRLPVRLDFIRDPSTQLQLAIMRPDVCISMECFRAHVAFLPKLSTGHTLAVALRRPAARPLPSGLKAATLLERAIKSTRSNSSSSVAARARYQGAASPSNTAGAALGRAGADGGTKAQETPEAALAAACFKGGPLEGVNFHGSLRSLCTVDPIYEKALSVACRGLHRPVVDTVEDGKRCLQFLHSKGLGIVYMNILEQVDYIVESMNAPFALPTLSAGCGAAEGAGAGASGAVPSAKRLFDLLRVKHEKFKAPFYFWLRDKLVTLDGKLLPRESSDEMPGAAVQPPRLALAAASAKESASAVLDPLTVSLVGRKRRANAMPQPDADNGTAGAVVKAPSLPSLKPATAADSPGISLLLLADEEDDAVGSSGPKRSIPPPPAKRPRHSVPENSTLAVERSSGGRSDASAASAAALAAPALGDEAVPKLHAAGKSGGVGKGDAAVHADGAGVSEALKALDLRLVPLKRDGSSVHRVVAHFCFDNQSRHRKVRRKLARCVAKQRKRSKRTPPAEGSPEWSWDAEPAGGRRLITRVEWRAAAHKYGLAVLGLVPMAAVADVGLRFTAKALTSFAPSELVPGLSEGDTVSPAHIEAALSRGAKLVLFTPAAAAAAAAGGYYDVLERIRAPEP